MFLYNSVSGKGKIPKKLPCILKSLRRKYDTVVLYETKSAADLEQIIAREADYFDAILFSGGDGTFNHVLRAAGGKDVQCGYIPSGTVNDIARSLGIPRSIKGALKVIERGETRWLDCLKVEDHYAMYIAAAGAFTSATYHTPQNSKRLLGALAYAFEAVKHNMKLEIFPIKATCGERTIETSAVLILVMNGKSVAGFPVNRSGSMTDGIAEIAIIKQVERPNLLRRIGAYFSVASLFVFGCRIRKKDILYLSAEKVKIEMGEQINWDFDGEEGFGGGAEITVCRNALKLFVPKNKKL